MVGFTHEYVLFQITWFETKIGTHLTHIDTHTHNTSKPGMDTLLSKGQAYVHRGQACVHRGQACVQAQGKYLRI